MNRIVLATTSALFVVSGSLAAVAAPLPADAGPVVENSKAMKAADQMPTSIRQQIQDQLGKNGYTNVKIMPSSFLVRATDKQGNPVEMVIGPDSVTSVTEIAPKTAAAPGTMTAPAAPATTPAPKG